MSITIDKFKIRPPELFKISNIVIFNRVFKIHKWKVKESLL